tara:strand:+ start:151 stop:480 length:330 start_codon:yes stop_codon:yes gene_type:complete
MKNIKSKGMTLRVNNKTEDKESVAEAFIDGANEKKKHGRGRPSFPWEKDNLSDRIIVFNVRMDSALHMKIEYLSQKEDISKHKFLRKIIEKEVEKRIKEIKIDKGISLD